MHELHPRVPITHRVVPQSRRANVKRPLFLSKCLLRRSDSVSHRGTDADSNVCFEYAPWLVADGSERTIVGDRLAPIARDRLTCSGAGLRYSATALPR